MKTSGIYKIQSVSKPERIYIGSALNMHRRRSEHFKRLRAGTHPNHKLKAHFRKYGENDLTFSVVECIEVDDLIVREQFYMDNLKPSFNICKIARSTKGVRQSKATKDKRAKAVRAFYQANKRVPPDTVHNYSVCNHWRDKRNRLTVEVICNDCNNKMISRLSDLVSGRRLCKCRRPVPIPVKPM